MVSIPLSNFKEAVDGSFDYILITDPDGIILYANSAIERITGFTPQEVIGKKAGTKDLWGGLMGKPFYERLWKILKQDKKPFTGEVKNKRKDGTLYDAFHTITPVLDKDGNVQFFFEIQRDITHDKEVDRAKTEFVSLASHQLRTPLTAINWYSEMLLSGDVGAVSEEQSHYLKEIYKGSQRMVRLVNDLLNVSRLEAGGLIVEPVPTKISSLISASIKEGKFIEAEREIPVRFKNSKEDIKLAVDSELLSQVLRNIINNAVRYCSGLPNPQVEVSLDKRAVEGVNSLVIKVEDNGIGIPKVEQHRVFEKFFRASNAQKEAPGGTGLGLYISKTVVEKWGGKMWFESGERKGTIFYVTIPLTGMVFQKGEKKLA